ncbi:UNVERIFIED_ORG: hypothetical protein FHU00_3937 [Citrobacter freundii]|uniref:hypothetical protein n=1 Tax=Citrobacter portucalensis TaxID=1639133 RepID=UPI00114F6FBC|nr:hypothetical protein [Citrobacter portucalensis]NUH52713.1 hypothetical protein [Citrobacter portucalensis]
MTIINTQTGELSDGVVFNGTVHKTFELRLPVMRDNGQALEEAEERFQTVEGFTADYYYRCAVMAATLIRLGDIPQEEVTAELLFDHMTPDDFNTLMAARGTLKVKRSGGNPGSPDSGSQSSSSDATE